MGASVAMITPILIAEVANAHAGSIERLFNIIDKIRDTKCGNIKFQLYSGRDICAVDHPRRVHFDNQSFSPAEWDRILSYTMKLGLSIHADIFGFDALEIALNNGLSSFKIHSSDTLNMPLIETASQFAERMFVSCGGTYIGEVIEAVDTIKGKANSNTEIVLMHGYQSYPSPVRTTALNRLVKLQRIFGSRFSFGYMDHIDGSSDDAIYFPLLALPYGIKYIEKHVTINRDEKLTDYYSSIDANRIDGLADKLDCYSQAFTELPLAFSPEEQKYRETTKKQWHIREVPEKSCVLPIVMQRPSLQSDGQLHFSQTKSRLGGLDSSSPGQLLSAAIVVNYINVIVLARTNSKRLPGKALLELPNNEPSIIYLLKKLRLGLNGKKDIYRICLATTSQSCDDQLAELAECSGFNVYRGDESDVLQRVLSASSFLGETRFTVRITGDDILIDTYYLDELVKHTVCNDYDYCENKALPSGMEVEVFKNSCLEQIWRSVPNRDETEYLTFFIRDNRDLFHIGSYHDQFLTVNRTNLGKIRLTVDYPADFSRICKIFEDISKRKSVYDINVSDILMLSESGKIPPHSEDFYPPKGGDINSSLNIENLRADPIVTVYIIIGEYSAQIERAIKSVLSQTLRKYHLFLINISQSAEVASVLRQFRHLECVTVAEPGLVSHSMAEDYVFSVCNTSYILKLDSLFELERHALELMVNELEIAPSKSYCSCDLNSNRSAHDVSTQYSVSGSAANDTTQAINNIVCALFRLNSIQKRCSSKPSISTEESDLLAQALQGEEGVHVDLPLFRLG